MQPDPQPQPQPRALIVEDSPVSLEFFTRQIERLGFTVETASTVPQAELLLRQHRYDLFLIDLILPGGDGLGLIYRLRSADPDTPVIAVSSGGPIDPAPLLQGALHAGASVALPKPVTPKQLSYCTEKLLAGTGSET